MTSRPTARPSRTMITRTRRSAKRAIAETCFACAGFLYYLFYPSNNAIETTRCEIRSARLPQEFDGLRIVQVSDLHGKKFGKDSERLLRAIAEEDPELVFITGDLLDERAFDLEYARALIRRLCERSLVFYITGNHEANFHEPYLSETLAAVGDAGAIVLRQSTVSLARRDGRAVVADSSSPGTLDVAGVDDPISGGREYRGTLRAKLEQVAPREGRFRILLSHRPETPDLYEEFGFDLVFSGHAHGGQFRFPGILPNGLNAPQQGWFPRLTGGLHEFGNTRLAISRGLGPSVLPTRLFNRPELVSCVLRRP